MTPQAVLLLQYVTGFRILTFQGNTEISEVVKKKIKKKLMLSDRQTYRQKELIKKY